MQLIRQFNSRLSLVFDQGAFDSWCVYFRTPLKMYAPSDLHYFKRLQKLGLKYGPQRVYSDFVFLFEKTHSTVELTVLEHIPRLAKKYTRNKTEMDLWFTVLYAGMVAEENKSGAKLKKRIKRLGMYQLLMENQTPEFASSFSKGKNWKALDSIMKTAGF